MIMEHEQMTAAAFAESIGVAQATISHTLGDRNKYPSTDFIMRLHEKYNHISLDWLLTGKGNMTDEEQISIHQSWIILYLPLRIQKIRPSTRMLWKIVRKWH